MTRALNIELPGASDALDLLNRIERPVPATKGPAAPPRDESGWLPELPSAPVGERPPIKARARFKSVNWHRRTDEQRDAAAPPTGSASTPAGERPPIKARARFKSVNWHRRSESSQARAGEPKASEPSKATDVEGVFSNIDW